MEAIGIEFDNLDRALALFVLVVPLTFASEPTQHLSVALDCGGQRFNALDNRAGLVLGQPRVELPQLVLQYLGEQHVGPTATHAFGFLWRELLPANG